MNFFALKRFFNVKSLSLAATTGLATHMLAKGMHPAELLTVVQNMPDTLEQAVIALKDIPLSPTLIAAATIGLYPKIDDSIDHLKSRFKRHSEEDIKRTAYHEAGHAIVQHLCPSHRTLVHATSMSNSTTLGHMRHATSKANFSRQEGINFLAMMQAGKVAEELVFGNHECGISGDLIEITTFATNMVKAYGMSSELPVKNYNVPIMDELLTDDDKKRIQKATDNIIKEAETLARKTLEENRPALDAVAEPS